MKKVIFFSKDLLKVMLVYVDKDTVKFDTLCIFTTCA